MLTIRNSELGEETFAPVCQLEHLRILSLSNCPNITSEMLCGMNAIGTLQSLELDACPHV